MTKIPAAFGAAGYFFDCQSKKVLDREHGLVYDQNRPVVEKEEGSMKKGEKRKLELLRTAYRMFLEKGYENTSVDEIIEAAGIAKGTYYYYFQSKEQTLEEVIGMMLDAEEERAKQVMAADLPAPQKMAGIIAAFSPDVGETAIRDTLNRSENIVMHDKINRRLTDRVVPLLSEVAEQGVREGLFACDHIPERVREILLLSNALFNEEQYTEADIAVFIDTVERIMYAAPGTMGFIAQIIHQGK